MKESLAGILQRPGRSALTVLGTVLGIGTFVAVLGLTATAGGQISQRFNVLLATSVSIEDVGTGDSSDRAISFPEDAEARVRGLNGVREAGVWWRAPGKPTVMATPGGDGEDGVGVIAASPGALRAMRPTLDQGVLFNEFHEAHHLPVAVMSTAVAGRLGVHRINNQPAIFIRGLPFTVVGLFDDVKRQTESLLSVIVPRSTALQILGVPRGDRAKMLIETELGAAQLVGRQAPLALRADAPELFKSITPYDPRSLKEGVGGDIGMLFVLLGLICLVIGAVGITNTTLVAVLERRSEIGLRRALGARPRHVAAQFLTESAALGTVGGLIGTSVGVLGVVCVSLARRWTAILDPIAVLPAPLIGSLIGLLAGLYPALRAARVEPVIALRQ